MTLTRMTVVSVAAGLLFCLSGCRWLIGFKAYQQCPARPVLIALPQEPGVNVSDPVTFRSTAGCTIVFEVIHRSYTGEHDEPLRDQDYEVRVEPVEPNGRIERGTLPPDGRVTVPTEASHTAVTITVFLPADYEEDGIQEDSAIVYLDPPAE